MVKTSTAEKNNYRCPACGDELHGDPSGRGFVRHVSNPHCLFEKGKKDAPDTMGSTAPARHRASTDPASPVKAHLREWAQANAISIDSSGYTLTLSDNLFIDLSPAARAEFSAGDGGELGSSGERGKMQALHSSSALACNVFEYWRERERGPLARALGVDDTIASVRFERKFPTGLPGNAPNLDVVLEVEDGLLVAIESKFLEPYGRPHPAGFKPKYFEDSPGLWERQGMRRCQAAAEALQAGEVSFRWLHAEQLLKHILGLSKSGAEWELLYLWYQPPGDAGTEHAAEAEAFAEMVAADGIGFRSMTYQELFGRLQQTCQRDVEYLDFLGSRYFATGDGREGMPAGGGQ